MEKDNQEILIKVGQGGFYSFTVLKQELEASLKPDLSKLKEGDEVWLRMNVGGYGHADRLRELNIVMAHFPKEQSVSMPEKCVPYFDDIQGHFNNHADKINGILDYLESKPWEK